MSEFDKDAVLAEIDKVKLAQGGGRGPSGWVYFIMCPETQRCKIGFTKGDAQKRLSSLQTGSASELSLVAMHPGTIETERALHEKFAASRLHGEWFELTNELRAYLTVTLWAMSEITLKQGRKLEPWMSIGLSISLESLETMSESLMELLERDPE